MARSTVFNPLSGTFDLISEVTIGTANGLSINSAQALSLDLSSTSTTGALSSTDWNTFNNKQAALTFTAPLVNTANVVEINGSVRSDRLSFVDPSDVTKKFTFDLSAATTGVTSLFQPQATQNTTYILRPNVDATANIITQNVTTGQIFIGADASIGGANSGIQYSNAVAANRGQIRLGSYINATSVAGVTTATSRSGTVGVNAAVAAGQDYSKWTAQAGATTAGSLPISGSFAFKANTVNSLTVASDYHIQLTNLAGTLGDRLYLSSEGLLQLPGYAAGVAQFDASGNISSAPLSPTSLSLANTHILVGNASNVAADVALSGDATLANTGALTLATVNSNTGNFGSATAIPTLTLNAKGLVVAASTNTINAPAGQLTGNTLASGVTLSSLTSLGVVSVGTWNAGTIGILYGGTGATTKVAAFDALSPMTTGGDLIYGGASGTGTRLANGSAGQVLTSSGGTAAPTWTTVTSNFVTPTIQKFTSGSGTYTLPTSPRAPLYIRVRMVGGGGGGSGSGSASGGAGAAGVSSTFGSTFLTATFGNGGTFQGGNASGGTGSITAGAVGTTVTGGSGGGYSTNQLSLAQIGSSPGGGTALGGAGAGSSAALAGVAGVANTGGGGSGGGIGNVNSLFTGNGGGGGGYLDAVVSSPSATYAYAVGTGGAAGTAGTNGQAGGAGGSGYIEVTEYYQ